MRTALLAVVVIIHRETREEKVTGTFVDNASRVSGEADWRSKELGEIEGIARRNDLLRRAIFQTGPPNALFLTRGVTAMGEVAVLEVVRKVQRFDEFRIENDPWGHHDFGAFYHDGEHIFWKIDDYRGAEGFELVLTIMLAEEY